MKEFRNDINKFIPRAEQMRAMSYIKNIEENKANNKFFMLNLPPGVGKSHLAMMIIDYYSKIDGNHIKADIITAGKILQDQYDDSYESIKNLKGKSNYGCSQLNCTCEEAKVMISLMSKKEKCLDCPYDIAKNDFVEGKVGLTNFHLFLTYNIFVGEYSPLYQRGSSILIVDEAHELDEVMSDFISLKVTKRAIEKYGYKNEKAIIKKLNSVDSITEYIDFLDFYMDSVSKKISSLTAKVGHYVSNVSSDLQVTNPIDIHLNPEDNNVKDANELEALKNIRTKIEIFKTDYEDNPDNWILEKNYNDKTSSYDLSMEPLWSSEYMDKYIWSKYDKIFLVSGTILDKVTFCEMNGIDSIDSVYYSMASPFPLNNRKIIYMPVGKMTYTNKEETFEKYKEIIPKILKKYSKDKGIIHTNSFELSNWLKDSNLDDRLMCHSSSDRDSALEAFMLTKEPKVFVSPSVTTGVSFDHDLARFQIIAKVPYPSLASEKNKQRQKLNPRWYSYMTILKLIQSYGRIVRSTTDFGDTIILDESFGDVLRRNGEMFPKWFLDAIKKYEYKS